MSIRLADIAIDDIVIGPNVRRSVGDITGLVDSIRAVGILQPLVCVPSADGRHVELLMGQRRLAAARTAGLGRVPCVLRPRANDRDRVIAQLAENHQRADMSPVDEACAFADLIGLGLTRSHIAKACNVSASYVERRLQLLELPETVRVAVDVGWVNMETALSLIPRDLLTDRDALHELTTILRRGDEAVRRWALERVHHRTTPIQRRSRDGKQLVARIRPDLHARALTAARRAGLTVAAWLEALIEQHVEQEPAA